jgi:competence protein ComGC
MRPTPIHKSEAFTLVELMLVILVVFVLLGGACFYVRSGQQSQAAGPTHCMHQ